MKQSGLWHAELIASTTACHIYTSYILTGLWLASEDCQSILNSSEQNKIEKMGREDYEFQALLGKH